MQNIPSYNWHDYLYNSVGCHELPGSFGWINTKLMTVQISARFHDIAMSFQLFHSFVTTSTDTHNSLYETLVVWCTCSTVSSLILWQLPWFSVNAPGFNQMSLNMLQFTMALQGSLTEHKAYQPNKYIVLFFSKANSQWACCFNNHLFKRYMMDS